MMRSTALGEHGPLRAALAAGAAAGAALVAAGALWSIVQRELGKRNDAADVRKLFRDIDKNGDGRLSVDELQREIQALCEPTADDKVNAQLAKRMLDAADTDRDGILTEDEFITGMAGELRPYLAVCLVPGGLTPHQITFTIPTSLLDSPAEEKASPGKLHVRVRLGAVHGQDEVEWDEWHNPLQDNSFDLQPRVVDDGKPLHKLAPVTIADPEDEKNYVHSGAALTSEAASTVGQLRHFTITGLLPSCDNPIMKRLGLERWRVEVQVGVARGLAWSHTAVHWYQNRTLSRDVPVAEVPEILTAWLEHAVGNHAVPEIIRLLQAKCTYYWSDSNAAARSQDLLKITASAKSLQDRVLKDNFLLPLATHPSAACQTLWGLLQSSDVREATLRDVARWTLRRTIRSCDHEKNLPPTLMLHGDTEIRIDPPRASFIGMRATPLRAEGWVAPGYDFLETYSTMAGHGGQETVGPEQLREAALFNVHMPADCPFAITVVIEVQRCPGFAPPQLEARCLNASAHKLPLHKILDDVSMVQPVAEGLHGVVLHLTSDDNISYDDGSSSSLIGIPDRSVYRYKTTLSFSRTNSRAHPSRPRKPVLDSPSRLVLQLAASQKGGEVSCSTIDINISPPALVHATASRGAENDGVDVRGSSIRSTVPHPAGPGLAHRRPSGEVPPELRPPRWQDLFRLVPQELKKNAGHSLNQTLIQYYLGEKALHDNDPTRFDIERCAVHEV
eukprot:COSAG02_NODE_209_length_28965_cov_18.680143_4_plen_731_part_00